MRASKWRGGKGAQAHNGDEEPLGEAGGGRVELIDDERAAAVAEEDDAGGVYAVAQSTPACSGDPEVDGDPPRHRAMARGSSGARRQ